jgi:leader peptidase (prepilin peptidase)/N-methyltransferase
LIDPFVPPVWLPAVLAPFVGSLLGVLVRRLPSGEPVVVARSRCPECGTRLGVLDLVPLLSWLWLGGRCRHCRRPIGLFYPGMELLALAIALWAQTVVSGWLLVATCALGWSLLTLALIDIRHFILPDVLTLPLVVAGLALAFALNRDGLIDNLVGTVAGFALFETTAVIYRRLRGREGLGRGDAKLMAAAGAWVAWQGLSSVILIGAGTALVHALGRGLAGRRPVDPGERIPFGPYLCLGIWIVWLYGPFTVA